MTTKRSIEDQLARVKYLRGRVAYFNRLIDRLAGEAFDSLPPGTILDHADGTMSYFQRQDGRWATCSLGLTTSKDVVRKWFIRQEVTLRG